MELDDYQKAAETTSLRTSYGDADVAPLIYPTLKLAGEAGEFAEKVGKLLRNRDGRIGASELGDVLWYVAEVAMVLGLDLNDVGARNLEKLRSRAERGVIPGSGDRR